MVGFWSKDDHGEPARKASVITDPSHIEELLDLGFHDGGFVDAVAGRPAGNGFGGICIKAKFKVKYWPVDAGGDERVPVGVDDGREAGL